MTIRIPTAAPDLSPGDVQEVLGVLSSRRLALGPMAEEFERLLAEYVRATHAVAVSSGTAALHLIVRALGIGPDNEVLVPSFTFVASANVIVYERAAPVFVDVEPDTYNLDPADLERKITPRTRAIMVVDVFGHPAEWDEVLRIAEKHGLRVIDDSCEALGAEYRGMKLGGFGDAAAFAFYPNKQITTGEGGMVVTNDSEIARLCRSMRNQGRSDTGGWLEHACLGYNYRMDEMSAALGVSQLRRIEEILAQREKVAGWYTERLRKLDWLEVPVTRPYVRRSWFVYVVKLARGVDRERVMAHLAAHGIESRPYFPPVHLQPFYRKTFGYRGGELPVTEDIARRTLALPFYNALSEEQVAYVCDVLADAGRIV